MANGLIVLLDALGAQKMPPDQYLESCGKLIEDIQSRMKTTPWTIHLDWLSFADNLLILEEIQRDIEAEDFRVFGVFCTYLLVEAFKQPLFFRGAMSVGDFVLDKKLHSALGKAVNDVARFYEDGNWSGILLTPHCAREWKRLLSKAAEIPFVHELTFLQYPHTITKTVGWHPWVLGWPHFIQTFEHRATKWDSKQQVIDLFQPAMNEAKGDELIKYENTLDFYDWYMAQDNEDDIRHYLIQQPWNKESEPS